MKIYNVDFKAMYPVGNVLIISAENEEQAREIALKTIIHTKPERITEIDINTPCVVAYLSGEH